MANVTYPNATPSNINRQLTHKGSEAQYIGDIAWWDDANHCVRPASKFTDVGGSEATKRAFAALFLGVLATKQLSTDSTGRTAGVLIDRIWTFPCTSATFAIGDYVTVTYSAGVLTDQSVEKTTDRSLAIGRVVKEETVATTTVTVRMISPLLSGNFFFPNQPTMQAQTAVGVAGAGQPASIKGGLGGPHTTGTGGVGGTGTYQGGQGGDATSGTGGAGGASTLGGAAGGAVTTGTGGAGGANTQSAGAGGAATGAAGIGGAGGALTASGGAGGASSNGSGGNAGAGGAVTSRGGAGGAASGTGAAAGGAGGAQTLGGGDGGTAAGTSAGGAGGATTIVSGAGGAKTGTGNAVGGDAGNLNITGGAGGNTASNGANAGGAGADVNITAGAGGNASAGTGNGGAGGSIPIRPGAGGTSAGGTAGVPGQVLLGLSTGVGAWAFGAVRSTISNAGTITDAQHRGMVLYQDASGGNVTMTTRTGTQLAAAFPDMATGDALLQYVASNHASNTSTISGGTSVTLVGSGAVTQLGGTFLLIKTGSTTFDLVRVG